MIPFRHFFNRNPYVDMAPDEDPSALGNMAVQRGYITKDELQEALKGVTREFRIGAVLIRMGKVTPEQFDDLLFEQRVRRGIIRDAQEIAARRHTELRRRMKALKRGFIEMQTEARLFTASLTNLSNSLSAGAK